MIYILPVLTSVISAVLAFVLQSVIRENHEMKQAQEQQRAEHSNALETGVVCLLRVRLIEYHSKYVSLGHITTHGVENWLLMYKAYKQLGGNGMIDHMKDDIEALQIEN